MSKPITSILMKTPTMISALNTFKAKSIGLLMKTKRLSLSMKRRSKRTRKVWTRITTRMKKTSKDTATTTGMRWIDSLCMM